MASRSLVQLAVLLACIVMGTCAALLHPREVIRERVLQLQSELAVAERELPSIMPGDQFASFRVETIDGAFTYDPTPPANPLVAMAFQEFNGINDAMWGRTEYVEDLLKTAPSNTDLLFLSYSRPQSRATEHVELMKTRLVEVMRALGWSSSEEYSFLQRCHFCTSPCTEVGGQLTTVLQEWRQSVAYLEADLRSTTQYAKRLDGRWPVIMTPQSVFGSEPQPLMLWNTPCTRELGKLNGSVALVMIQRNDSCSLFEMVHNAMWSNGSAVVFVQEDGESLVDVNCNNFTECNTLITIPATMIPHHPGSIIRDALLDSAVQVSFLSTRTNGMGFSLDSNGAVGEIGSVQYPSLLYFAYVAQFLNYRSEVLSNISGLAATQPVSVTVYNKTIMNGPTTVVATMPSRAQVTGKERVILNMALGCINTLDAACPAWDRTLQLNVSCPALGEEHIGFELGRWITPFKRGNGQWLTDVSPLFPLLIGDEPTDCSFTISVGGKTDHWAPTLEILFAKRTTPPPAVAISMFDGSSSFNAEYNIGATRTFDVPSSATKVILYAVITGHGGKDYNCAEFCKTGHHFSINDRPAHNVTFPIAGTPMGCANKVRQGVLPNEYGTWLYGRDGWCDGQNVPAHTWDITSDVNVGGSNSLTYYAWFRGASPAVGEDLGNFKRSVWVVIYE